MVDKSTNKYTVLLFAGLLGIVVAGGLYTPLDHNLTLFAFGFGVFVGVLNPLSDGRPAYFIGLVRRVLAFVAIGLVLLAAFVFLNGALDHYPLVRAETRVTRTYRAARTHDFFIVVSPSWRKGRNQEDFQPIGDFDGDLQTGDLVRVEVHRGAFWLPWGPVVTKRTR